MILQKKLGQFKYFKNEIHRIPIRAKRDFLCRTAGNSAYFWFENSSASNFVKVPNFDKVLLKDLKIKKLYFINGRIKKNN